MLQGTTIGLDIAMTVFQAHGADERGVMMSSRKRDFFAKQPKCRVAMEACSGAPLGAPAYVKPFAKRRKNDAVDAAAICEVIQVSTGL